MSDADWLVDDEHPTGWRRLRVDGRTIALVPELRMSWVVAAPHRSRVLAPPDETRELLARSAQQRRARRRRGSP